MLLIRHYVEQSTGRAQFTPLNADSDVDTIVGGSPPLNAGSDVETVIGIDRISIHDSDHDIPAAGTAAANEIIELSSDDSSENQAGYVALLAVVGIYLTKRWICRNPIAAPQDDGPLITSIVTGRTIPSPLRFPEVVPAGRGLYRFVSTGPRTPP